MNIFVSEYITNRIVSGRTGTFCVQSRDIGRKYLAVIIYKVTICLGKLVIIKQLSHNLEKNTENEPIGIVICECEDTFEQLSIDQPDLF
jgi:hypothetical protein